MGILLPNVYSQQDDRWGQILLGFNVNQPYNFYNYACLITCLAMVARYYGKNDTPVTVNDFLKALKPAGFAAGGGEYVWGSFHRQYGDIEEVRVVTPDTLNDAQMGEIKSALDAGYPVMLHLDYNPKTVQNDMHFVLAIGYNPGDENDITIADPIGGRVHSLKDYLGWYKPSARNTIEQYVIFKGNVPNASTGCLIDGTKEGKQLFVDLVHGSGEYDKVVHEYVGPSADPKATAFEQVRSVISGFKSRITDLENKVSTAQSDVEKANVEIANQKDKVANVQAECQTQLTLKNAEIDALNGNAKALDKLKGQYEGTIATQAGTIRELQKAGGQKDLTIADLKKQLELAKKGVPTQNQIQVLIDFLKGFLKK